MSKEIDKITIPRLTLDEINEIIDFVDRQSALLRITNNKKCKTIKSNTVLKCKPYIEIADYDREKIYLCLICVYVKEKKCEEHYELERLQNPY